MKRARRLSFEGKGNADGARVRFRPVFTGRISDGATS
jgi:hypothetical protein